MVRTRRIAIVGGGAVGSETAYALSTAAAKADVPIQIDIYEKNRPTSHHPVCTGLFTTAIETFFDKPIQSYPFFTNLLTGTNIHTADDAVPPLDIPLKEYLVDRKKFDEFIRNRARQSGATFHYNHDIQEISTKSDKTHILSIARKNTIIHTSPYDTIILTTGPTHPSITGFSFERPAFLTGLQYFVTLEKPHESPSTFECYFLASNQDFFYWVVPEDKYHLRIGTAAKTDARTKLDTFLTAWTKQNKISLKESALHAAPIPLYSAKYKKSRRKAERKGIFFAGDAGVDIKDTTGGGIVPAFQNAHRFADWYCAQQNGSFLGLLKSTLRQLAYEQKLRTHARIMGILRKNNFQAIEHLCKKLSKPKSKQILATITRDNIVLLTLRLLLSDPSLLTILISRKTAKRRLHKR